MEKILDKKLDNYSVNTDNFRTEEELMVQITLNEYRNLVSSSATTKYQIDKANEDRYERNSENDRLKKENADLKAEIYELKKSLDERGEVIGTVVIGDE